MPPPPPISCSRAPSTDKTEIPGMPPDYSRSRQDLSRRLVHHRKTKIPSYTSTHVIKIIMFSLQNQNQAIFTLSQVTTAIISPRHRTYLNNNNNKKSSTRKHPEEILCADSFNETLRNFNFAFVRTVKQIPNKYRVSYTSHETFIENKHENCLPRFVIGGEIVLYKRLTQCLRQRNRFAFDVQVRTFKTERSLAADLQRNPTLFTRLKNALGFQVPESLDQKLQGDQGASHERFRQLLAQDEGNLSEAEKQRMKVAFAEGYLLGNNPKSGKAARYFKVMQQVLTIAIFLAIVVSLMATANGSMFRIQLGNHVEVDPEDIHVTFDDVKGADEAKQELKDVVEFLKNPEKFSNLGGKLPKGVLLVGPPGTGKTLLARAVAGEAGVPFFHAAGPEFDEILVGQGAKRVRDLFKAAKERAPCVIFIDEIDSVGAKRTNSVLHPYANQTINQLLSEMDGFHQNEGVIVLGATNRRDDLDQALLRPGRFDVEVTVPTPDYVGRKEILSLYLGKILAKEIDVDVLARGTTGFTGADLENMVNQAALRAAIDGADSVSMKYLESARDKVLMGPERKSRIPDEEANLITAYHEGGHAIVAYFTKDSHPLHKVTIIPRGPSLGHTAYIPEKERYHVTKAQLLAMMDTMMGGRAAEELIFGPEKITSGASSDLKQATSIATHMVKDWGMSEKIGLRTMSESTKPFSGEVLGPQTNELVDNEIRRILSESYERAKYILKTHAKEHKALAEALLKYETLDADDIKAIMADKTPNIEKS